MEFGKKHMCVAIIAVLVLGLGYYMYSNSGSSCGCGCQQSERFGPQYLKPIKGPERFSSGRANEQGPYYERFNIDFTAVSTSEPLQEYADSQSPFIGALDQSELN